MRQGSQDAGKKGVPRAAGAAEQGTGRRSGKKRDFFKLAAVSGGSIRIL